MNDAQARLCITFGILILMITVVFALEIMYENLTNTVVAATHGGEYSIHFFSDHGRLSIIVILSLIGGCLIALGIVRPRS